MDVFTIKRGDTSPSLDYLLDPATVDLTGATVRFSMRNSAGTLVLDRVTASAPVLTVAPKVRYAWSGADTAVAGFYRAEFEVTYAGGAIETFPNFGAIGVLISADG